MRVRREGRLLRLTLDRPEKRNALDSATCEAIVREVEQASDDRATGAILLDGEGPSFCAGMDLEESLLPDAADRNAIHERLFSLGRRSLKPIVAAVQGAALAGGAGLVASCHIAVAAEDALFGITEIKIGLWPMLIWRSMVQAIGERRALELSLTGRRFGADEALEWGLVHYVVPAFELQAKALHIAATIAESSPEAIRRGMTLTHQGREMSEEEATRLAATLRARLFRSEDYQEGVRAWKQKRPPRWPSLEGKSEDDA